MCAAPMDLLGGSVGMNFEPEWPSASGLLGIHDPEEQVSHSSVSVTKLILLRLFVFINL